MMPDCGVGRTSCFLFWSNPPLSRAGYTIPSLLHRDKGAAPTELRRSVAFLRERELPFPRPER